MSPLFTIIGAVIVFYVLVGVYDLYLLMGR